MKKYIVKLEHGYVISYVKKRLSEFDFTYTERRFKAMKMCFEDAEEIKQLLSYADFNNIQILEK